MKCTKMVKSKGWDELLRESVNRWNYPNEHIPLLAEGLKQKFNGTIRVLDIGYGAGRHLIYFHRCGFVVHGFDIADNAERYARERLSATGPNSIDLKIFNMVRVPWSYNSESFEGALAINVIHHTNYDGFLKIINEIHRILVSGGLFLATIASKANHKFGVGKRIDDYTYLIDSGAEKGIPHCFFDEKDIKRIIGPKYSILKLMQIRGEIPDADKAFRKENALDHWLLYLEKK